MAVGKKYNILLCGRKDLLLQRVKKMIDGADIHFQYTSSPRFLIGRALFEPPQTVIADGDLPHPELLAGLQALAGQFPAVTIYVVATRMHSQEIVQFLQSGAKGFFYFPTDYRKFRETMRRTLDTWRKSGQSRNLRDFRKDAFDFSQLVGESPCHRVVLDRAKTLIRNNANTILITGETGTGKSLLARMIHYNSPRRDHNYVDITASTLPDTLLESELFGYERGAFTDARERKIGLFELAGDGTIFLDEIGDISKTMQAKLLGVLENRTIRRLGGVKDIPVRACVIVATSVPLEQRVESGEFRKDLYHRLKILPLELPPLRARREDIPCLVESIIQTFNGIYKKQIKGIVPKASKLLVEHRWEGNIRELRHCIERAVLLAEDDWLTEHEFELPPVVPATAPRPAGKDGAFTITFPYKSLTLAKAEREIVERVLTNESGNKSRTAQILGISRPRLARILNNTRRNGTK